jgi:hypothetical protein
MPKVHRYNIKLANDERWQNLHDLLIKEHIHSQLTPDQSNLDSMVLNGRSTRILNLGAVSPLLLLATGIHKAKVEAERDSVTGKEQTQLGDADEDIEENEEEEEETAEGSDDDGASGLFKREVKKMESPELKEYREYFMASPTSDLSIWKLRSSRSQTRHFSV